MYNPEKYWNIVASKIHKRDHKSVVAGDDEPFYRYKRKKFLELLMKIDFRDKIILEVGFGPGGNLLEILKHLPRELHGVDISETMVSIAKANLASNQATLTKIDGENLPYADTYFDISFTATVLQHVTNEKMLSNLVTEIARVTKGELYLFERIEKSEKGSELNLGRPVVYYKNIIEANGFALESVEYLNVHISFLFSGLIRKLFTSHKKQEGDPFPKLASLFQNMLLPITSFLDPLVKIDRELAMLRFRRT